MISKYIFLGGNRIASIQKNSQDASTRVRFYHSDHLGSSNVVTDEDGNLAQLLEYTPFGVTSRQEGEEPTKYRFTSKEFDDTTSLYYYGARYYDPELGRFITPDTIVQDPGDPQFLNRYTYARNNPVKFIDPTGNFAWFAFFSLIAKIAGWIALGATVISFIAYQTGNVKIGKLFGTIAKIAGIIAAVASIGAMLTRPPTPTPSADQALAQAVPNDPLTNTSYADISLKESLNQYADGMVELGIDETSAIVNSQTMAPVAQSTQTLAAANGEWQLNAYGYDWKITDVTLKESIWQQKGLPISKKISENLKLAYKKFDKWQVRNVVFRKQEWRYEVLVNKYGERLGTGRLITRWTNEFKTIVSQRFKFKWEFKIKMFKIIDYSKTLESKSWSPWQSIELKGIIK